MGLFSRNKKDSGISGNRRLTPSQKSARLEADELALKTAEAATLAAAKKAQKIRELASNALSEDRRERAKKRRTERAKRNNTGKFIRDLLSGRFLTGDGITSHIPYLLFVTGIFLVYISLGYHFENIEREKMKTEQRLEEVTSEYKTLRSELESILQQSRVERATADLGLEQPITPPILLKVDAE
ncbi:MAG: hypothetical protein COA49_00915 [Bacteroidetes bacterium]|nr:MAG: hypothetical protein COA49_00915 [Bacteroidota bacterium]